MVLKSKVIPCSLGLSHWKKCFRRQYLAVAGFFCHLSLLKIVHFLKNIRQNSSTRNFMEKNFCSSKKNFVSPNFLCISNMLIDEIFCNWKCRICPTWNGFNLLMDMIGMNLAIPYISYSLFRNCSSSMFKNLFIKSINVLLWMWA